jgi:preprotein translocase subunit SecD
MLEFPRWKYILVAIALVLGTFYVLPNAFRPDPSVQITAQKAQVVDDALRERVQGFLETAKVPFKEIELDPGRKQILVRLDNLDEQNRAGEVLSDKLAEDGYTAALSLGSTVPRWMELLRAQAMTLGLDLQGGMHLLLEVDRKTALDNMRQRFVDDVRTLLRDKRISGRVEPTPTGLLIILRNEAGRDTAFSDISRDMPQLELRDGTITENSFPLVATIKESEVRATMTAAVEQNTTTLRNRLVGGQGLSEPVIQRQGEDRIVVQMPGVQDATDAKNRLGATATLEYRAVDERNMPSFLETGRVPPESAVYTMRETGQKILLSKKIIVSGDQLTHAQPGYDQRGAGSVVEVTLNALGGRRMQEFTDENVGNRMGVVYVETKPRIVEVDGEKRVTYTKTEEVINAATIQGRFGKRFQTSGLGKEESVTLSQLLNAGSLAAPVAVVEERTIGPSLGQENIRRGAQATLVGFGLVLIFMAFYYRVFGLIAGFALIANTILLGAILSVFGATLTMPGIAALLLTVGMAVDANVLICERVREELRAGNTPVASIRAGYDKAWHTIVDANVTHLLSGVALFAFGSGPIRGFAMVLVCGILTSMFTSVTVTEAVVSLIYGGRRRPQKLSI